MKCSFYLKTTLTSTKPVKDSEQVFIVLKINVYRRFCEGFDKVIKLFAWNNFTQIFFLSLVVILVMICYSRVTGVLPVTI